ncbi:MAG: hypothetical protein IJK58_00960 [Clostridia bacterium]|nr:hypothetical protein [Clostridia bacterium]
MMVGWIIAGCVLFLILLLLFSVAKAEIRSDGTLSLKAGIGVIMIRILPKKEKKPPKISSFSQKKYLRKMKRQEEKAKKKEAKKARGKTEKEKAEKKEKPKKSFSEKFDEVKKLLSVIVETAGKYSKKLRIAINGFRISVGAEEASDVALRYGAISQSVSYLLEFLDVNTDLTVKEGAVDVTADFISGKFDLFADVSVGIRVINVLRIGLSVLVKKIKKG